MNAPVQPLATYQLADRYGQSHGRVFMSGTQALVRVLLDQARRDKQAGLNTCLLYTSPSPRDGLLSRMPSSA